MHIQFSLPLIAALLLASHIIARAMGLRSPKNLAETFGLGGSIGATLIAAIALHWPIAHFVLLPFGLEFMNTLVAVLLIATCASIVEALLHKKLPDFFPVEGNLLPQIFVGAFILALPLIEDISFSFVDALLHALLYGICAKLLLAIFHVVREHSASAETPAALRGPAIELISAGLLVAALGGIAGIF
jgi:electron transport complex protein RnfA